MLLLEKSKEMCLWLGIRESASPIPCPLASPHAQTALSFPLNLSTLARLASRLGQWCAAWCACSTKAEGPCTSSLSSASTLPPSCPHSLMLGAHLAPTIPQALASSLWPLASSYAPSFVLAIPPSSPLLTSPLHISPLSPSPTAHHHDLALFNTACHDDTVLPHEEPMR